MSDPPADSSDDRTDGEPAEPPDDSFDPSESAQPEDADGPSVAGDADPSGPTAPDGAADIEDEDASESYESSGSGMRARDVEVPMRVYKTVTVFSTLIAVVCVVGGFVLLDRATNRAQLPLSEVDPVVALAGIGTILFGAAIYAFATRFRARGMGRSKNDADHSSDNG